jgi:hypothetical protein
MSNPLVATAQSDTTAVTGIGIAESSMDLASSSETLTFEWGGRLLVRQLQIRNHHVSR